MITSKNMRILKILNNDELQNRLKREAKPYAESWSAKVMAERAMDFYQKTIEQRH